MLLSHCQFQVQRPSRAIKRNVYACPVNIIVQILNITYLSFLRYYESGRHESIQKALPIPFPSKEIVILKNLSTYYLRYYRPHTELCFILEFQLLLSRLFVEVRFFFLRISIKRQNQIKLTRTRLQNRIE